MGLKSAGRNARNALCTALRKLEATVAGICARASDGGLLAFFVIEDFCCTHDILIHRQRRIGPVSPQCSISSTMRTKNIILGVLALAITSFTCLSARAASSLTAGFSYQGRLFDQGVAANGQYEMTFFLRDQASGGNAVGSGVSISPVVVSNGLFQASFDFGTNV